MSPEAAGEDPAIPAAPEETPVAGPDLARTALSAARRRATAGARKPARARRSTRTESGAGGEPQLFGAALAAFVAERGWATPTGAVAVMDRWAEIVGPDIAGKTEPESFDEGVLLVRTSSTAWAVQLRLIAPDIIRRINVELGHGSIQRLDVRGPAGPNWTHGRLRVRDGRGPRDTYG